MRRLPSPAKKFKFWHEHLPPRVGLALACWICASVIYLGFASFEMRVPFDVLDFALLLTCGLGILLVWCDIAVGLWNKIFDWVEARKARANG